MDEMYDIFDIVIDFIKKRCVKYNTITIKDDNHELTVSEIREEFINDISRKDGKLLINVQKYGDYTDGEYYAFDINNIKIF